MPAILSTCYFPPIPWFMVASRAGNFTIDIHEHYIKQTWRNRCRIMTANRKMDLVIPVKKFHNHTPMNEIRIDYSTEWIRVHTNAIRSAYGKSAYFEHYSDVILSVYEGDYKPELLIEWNEITLNAIIECLALPVVYTNSAAYAESPLPDWRSIIVPDSKSPLLPATPKYIQVFEERHGFQRGLSVLDLLFCAGPDAKEILNGNS